MTLKIFFRRICSYYLQTFLICTFFLVVSTEVTFSSTTRSPVLQVGLAVLPNDLDPTKIRLMEHFLVLQCLCQTMVRVTETGAIVGDLADRWEIKDNGTSVLFSIDKEALFSDGTPVTGEDVAYSFNRHLELGSPSAVAGYLRPILRDINTKINGIETLGIQVIDNSHVLFKLSHAYPPFLRVLAMPGFCIHKKKSGAVTSQFIGSGPMLQSPSKTPNTIELSKSPYYRGSVGVPKIIFKQITSAHEASSLFKQNQLDMVLGLPLTELSGYHPPKGVQVKATDSFAIVHLYFNNSRNIFKNLDFRRDLSRLFFSIGKKVSNNSPFFTPQDTFLPKGILPASYYQRNNPEVTPAELMSKWRPLIGKRTLKIVLMRAIASPDLVNSLKNELALAGFGAKIHLVDLAELLTYISGKNFDYDLIGVRYVGNFSDPDAYIGPLQSGATVQYGVIPSGDFFSSLNSIRYLSDSAERLQKYGELLRNFEEQYFFAPMFRLHIPILLQDRVHIPETSYRYESELWKVKLE